MKVIKINDRKVCLPDSVKLEDMSVGELLKLAYDSFPTISTETAVKIDNLIRGAKK